ncbi:hypothetical protein BDQ17DRAFT_482009 [Cyathus striatus]|nr:hypothetical protein BDQ17DRAFT_482009 [Cyathus striatus]
MASTDEYLPKLLKRAQRFLQDGKFVLSSIPNADRKVAEHSVRQLQATKSILLDINDSHLLSKEELIHCVFLIDEVLQPLEEFLRSPEPVQMPQATTESERNGGNSRTGPLRFDLNLDRAIQLHDMGNTWEDIAGAIGVCRKTLYTHLSRNGYS